MNRVVFKLDVAIRKAGRAMHRYMSLGMFTCCFTGVMVVGAQAQPDIDKPITLADMREEPAPDVPISDALGRLAVRRATAGGLPLESRGVWGMSPHASADEVRAALSLVSSTPTDGPVTESWQSLADQYRVPDWLLDAKFGIFIHFGLYSIPAHGSEWYQKHMYSDPTIRAWHEQQFGPLDRFGYKDFIPRFTLPEFHPDQWAEVFRESGGKFVLFSAEHHDGYSLWSSKVNRFNSVESGPRRDLVQELSEAVRSRGLKFGVTNHSIEHYDFIESQRIPVELKTDLVTPGFEDFYWTTHSSERLQRHLANWVEKNYELIDQYQPDMLWFDNGLNHRAFDPLKLRVAAHYYNRARQWNKPVTLVGKGTCFIAGGLQDFETMSRAPQQQTDFPWMVHDKLASSWGYIEGQRVERSATIVRWLIEVICRNGVLALNVGPRGDGAIPADQINALREIGGWLGRNGEAVYGTEVWRVYGEAAPESREGGRYSPHDIRFTQKDGNLYAFLMSPAKEGKVLVKSLKLGGKEGTPTAVHLLGDAEPMRSELTSEGLEVVLPEREPTEMPIVLRIEGLRL